MKCLIVDDDLNCIKALSGIIKDYIPTVEIVGTVQNIKDAVQTLNANEIDLVFLDVEIQHEMGFDLFKYIPKPKFEVVFTTAHEKYALKAIKSSCFDFLLKPIETEELIATVQRFSERLNEQKNTGERASVLMENLENTTRKVEKIAITNKDGLSILNTEEIMYLEGDAKYTTLHLVSGERYVSSKNIGEFEDLLDSEKFFRCHRSWMINLKYVVRFLKFDYQLELSNKKLIDVSTRKKEEFLKLFNKV